MSIDTVEEIIGQFGLYQMLILIIVSSSTLFLGCHMMIIIFLAPPVSYYCNGDKSKNNTCPCDKPTYDRSIFKNTITMEWDLICNRGPLDNLTQALYHLGTLIGSLVFGALSDSYGRKYTLASASLVQFVTSLASGSVMSFYFFIVLRFLLGFGVGGTMIVSYVYVMEIMGTKYREMLAVFHQIPFYMGHTLLPVFSYYIRDFRQLLFWTSLGQCSMLLYVFLPESPRWLIAVNKLERATTLLTTIAELNARNTDYLPQFVEIYHRELGKFEELKKRHARDLLTVKHLRSYVIAMSYLWFSSSFCFYGAAQFIGHVPGNVFINVGVSALSSLICGLSSIYLLKTFGRKRILSILNFFSFACFVMLTIAQEYGELFFATLGFCSLSMIFVFLYILTLELFPTVVRNSALGICSMSARIAAMIAAFVVDAYEFYHWVPPLIFCLPPLIAGFVSFTIPETKGVVLTTTITENKSIIKIKSKHNDFFLEDQSDYDTMF